MEIYVSIWPFDSISWDNNCFISICQRPHKANQEEMTKYHSDDYIRFLKNIRPDNMSEFNKQMQRCTDTYIFY